MQDSIAWVKQCKAPNQTAFGPTQSEMVLTEPGWDWNWSCPGPSCGSQLYDCNHAAKRES